MKTMRIWILLISFMVFLLGQAEAVLAAPALDIETALSPDNIVEARVYINDVQDLREMRYAVVFDPSLLEVSEVTMGQFLAQNPTASQTIAGIDNECGVIGPVTSVLGSDDLASGSGLASIIKFKALRPGATVVEFSYRYLEGINGAEITCSTNQGAAVLIDSEQFHKMNVSETRDIGNQHDEGSGGMSQDKSKDRQDIDNDLSVSFTADKQADKITLTAEVNNKSSDRKSLEFPSSQRYDIEISRQGKNLYRWSDGKLFLMGFENQAFAPGSTRFLEIWEIPQGTEPGVYDIMFSITAVEPLIGRMQLHI